MKIDIAILRLMLILVAVMGLSCGGVPFIPWESTAAIIKHLAIQDVPAVLSSPIIEYWLMTMAAVCVVVGYLYLVAAVNPAKYKNVLPILGWGLVLIGITVGYHGFRLGLPPWPFYADLLTCGLCGPGIVWLLRKV